MTHLHRSVMRKGKARLRFWVVLILSIVVLAPGKAEQIAARTSDSSATASARAKIHKRFEVGPKVFAEPKSKADRKTPDISLQDCDAEVRKIIRDCVLMVYEIQ